MPLRKLAAEALFAPTLGWNVLLGRMLRVRRWWDRIDDHVVIGALPFPSDVRRLYREGVRGIVNTCREYGGPQGTYARLGIRQLRIGTVDFTPPSLEAVEQAVAFIDDHASRGESVYVHCKAGRARSATVVLCWLMHRHGMSPEEGQRLLLDRRPHVHRRLPARSVVQDFLRGRSGDGRQVPLRDDEPDVPNGTTAEGIVLPQASDIERFG